MSDTQPMPAPPADAGPILFERFQPRGIGLDAGMPCFICGAQRREDDANSYMHNIAAFVQSREAGGRVLKMFNHRPRLDYRDFEPTWIQVKVGACTKHLLCLEDLMNRTSAAGGAIGPTIIAAVFEKERVRVLMEQREKDEAAVKVTP